MKSHRRAILIIFTVSLLLTPGFLFFPPISDDISFALPFRDYFVDGAPLPDVDRLVGYARHIHNTANSRLANMVMIPVQFLPRWLLAMMSGAMFFITLICGLRLIGRARSAFCAAIFSALAVFILPWADQIYVFNFQLNYLWGGALWCLFAVMYLGRGAPWWLMAPLALLLGLWQECVAVPALASVIVMAASSRDYRDRRSIVTAAALSAGLAWLYFSPGGTMYRHSTPLFAGRFNIVVLFMLPAMIFLAWVAVRSLRRKLWPGGAMLYLTVSAAASLAVALLTAMGPRVGWIASLAASAGLTLLIDQAVRRHRTAIAALAVLLTAWHLAAVAVEAYRLGRHYDTIVTNFRADPAGEQFAPLDLRADLPAICLQKPYSDIFSHRRQVEFISRYHHAGSEIIKAVPGRLREFTAAAAEPVAGSGDRFFTYRGLLVGPAACGDQPADITIRADYGSGLRPTLCYTVPFTDAAGCPRAWYYPATSTLATLLHPLPTEISGAVMHDNIVFF